MTDVQGHGSPGTQRLWASGGIGTGLTADSHHQGGVGHQGASARASFAGSSPASPRLLAVRGCPVFLDIRVRLPNAAQLTEGGDVSAIERDHLAREQGWELSANCATADPDIFFAD